LPPGDTRIAAAVQTRKKIASPSTTLLTRWPLYAPIINRIMAQTVSSISGTTGSSK
jgi:hypothetical protein